MSMIVHIESGKLASVTEKIGLWKDPDLLIMSNNELSDRDISLISGSDNVTIEPFVHEKVVSKRERVVSGYSYYVFAN